MRTLHNTTILATLMAGILLCAGAEPAGARSSSTSTEGARQSRTDPVAAAEAKKAAAAEAAQSNAMGNNSVSNTMGGVTNQDSGMINFTGQSTAPAMSMAGGTGNMIAPAPGTPGAPPPPPNDERIKQLVYNEGDVYTITTKYGYQTNIVLSPKEDIETISVGDKSVWQIIPSGNRIFIRPMEEDSITNMTVLTNKHSYQFDLKALGPAVNEGNIYVATFIYPEDMVAAAQAAANAMASQQSNAYALGAPYIGMPPLDAQGNPVNPPMGAPNAMMPPQGGMMPPANNAMMPPPPGAVMPPPPNNAIMPPQGGMMPPPAGAMMENSAPAMMAPPAAMPPMAPPAAMPPAQEPMANAAQAPMYSTPAYAPAPLPANVPFGGPTPPPMKPVEEAKAPSAKAAKGGKQNVVARLNSEPSPPTQYVEVQSGGAIAPAPMQPAPMQPAPMQTAPMPTALAAAAGMEVAAPVALPANANFNYTYTGADALAPLQVFDDGKVTYLKYQSLGPVLPDVYVLDAGGHVSPVAHSAHNGFMVVDTIAPEMIIKDSSGSVHVYNESLAPKQ